MAGFSLPQTHAAIPVPAVP